MTENAQSRESLLANLHDLPPSAKLVFKVLEYHDELTQNQLADETLLSQRTVRGAAKRLEEKNLVTSQISFKDARKRVYSLAPELRHQNPAEES